MPETTASTAAACLARGLLAGALAWGAAAGAWAQKVRLATTAGDMVIELDREHAPKSVDNFVQYVKAGHYDGTVFHRVIPGFMVQGGGMTPDLKQKPVRAPIALEARNGVLNQRGTVAMARTADADSATSQFFVNLKHNAFLDASQAPGGAGYAVFGKVVSGMDTVDRIAAVATGSKGAYQDVPLQSVIINKATLEP